MRRSKRIAGCHHQTKEYVYSFSGLDNSLLRNEDTVEELTFVLCANLAALRDLSAGKGNTSVVNTFEDKFVLNIS